MAKPYDQIPDRRAIVRRRALEEALAHLVEDLPSGGEPPRPAVLALLRDALAAGRAEIRRRFEEPGPLRNDGDMVLASTSFLMDQLIRVVFDFADQRIYGAANPSTAERLGVVATGGYGRGELAPLSDIDLLFLRPYKQTPRGEQIVEFMLYLLWDMGLKVGHATRTVDESLRYADRDQTIRTALLEARYVWGDRALFDELIKGFTQKFLTGDGRDFVEAKLAERDQRHQRMGDSRYVVEPNVKEGKGGLRDLHLLVLDRRISLSRARARRAGGQGRAHQGGGAPFRARRALLHHGALPHPLSHRPRRRPPVVRPAARDRRAARLPGPAGQPAASSVSPSTTTCMPRRWATSRASSWRRSRTAAGASPSWPPCGRPCGRASSTASASTASAWPSPRPTPSPRIRWRSCACSMWRRRTISTSIPRPCG